MKRLTIAILLLAAPAMAQTLPDKPRPVSEGDWIGTSEPTPDNPMPPVPDNLVLTPRWQDGRHLWHVEQVGTCEWCGRPMTWRQAAFDKKALPLWLAEIGLSVADTEIAESRPCIKQGTCKEGNFFLGPSRAQQYGVRIPILLSLWAVDSFLRKGDLERRHGGLKHWWVFPTAYIGLTSAGIISNLARH